MEKKRKRKTVLKEKLGKGKKREKVEHFLIN